METPKGSIFISHKKENLGEILPFIQMLESSGIPCWYAPRNIPEGQEYQTRIAMDIEKVELVLVFITKDLEQSVFVPKEVDRAITYNKIILPVMMDGSTVPKSLELFLCNIQWFDLYQYPSREEGWEDLKSIVEDIYEGKNSYTPITQASSTISRPYIHKVAGQEHLVLYEAHPNTVQKVRDVYVPPRNVDGMVERLQKDRWLILESGLPVGKYSTGIYLLDRLNAKQILEWPVDILSAELLTYPLKKDTGYLVKSNPALFQQFSQSQIEYLQDQLKEKHSYMVFLSELPIGDMNSGIPVFQLTPTYDKQEILFNHIRASGAEIDLAPLHGWLQSPSGMKLVAKLLYPYELVGLAEKLVRFSKGELSENELIESDSESVKERIRGWVSQPKSLNDFAFYFSLTLYEGETYAIITRKSQDLLSVMNQPHLAEVTALKQKQEYLQSYFAYIQAQSVVNDLGARMVEKVFLKVQEDAFFFWSYMWDEFPQYRDSLAEWINQSAPYIKANVQNRLMEILTVLARMDLDSIRKLFLLPWAKSKNAKSRKLAILLLNHLNNKTNFQKEVLLLVKGWARSGNQQLQATVCTLLGSPYGFKHFPTSLEILKEIYQTNRKRMYFSLKQSYQQITAIVSWDKKYEITYLQFWNRWLESITDKKGLVELLSFSHSIFQANREMFLKADTKRIPQFWLAFFLVSYSYRDSRVTANRLLDGWIRSCTGNEHYREKVVELIYTLYVQLDSNKREKLDSFLASGCKINEQTYGPVCQKLIQKV